MRNVGEPQDASWPSIQAPGQKKKRNPKLVPQDRYTVTSYARAMTESIKRHNVGKPDAEKLVHWHPHQLRHLRRELKRPAGLDVARTVHGHGAPRSRNTMQRWTWPRPWRSWRRSVDKLNPSGRPAMLQRHRPSGCRGLMHPTLCIGRGDRPGSERVEHHAGTTHP